MINDLILNNIISNIKSLNLGMYSALRYLETKCKKNFYVINQKYEEASYYRDIERELIKENESLSQLSSIEIDINDIDSIIRHIKINLIFE